mmetsp:Transcript_71432/g.165196  ORF Transcript_71432/g.165196 Transcript_71432/m.165196 type:complete len:210 (-) Transcript_71432:755-1384(-)
MPRSLRSPILTQPKPIEKSSVKPVMNRDETLALKKQMSQHAKHRLKRWTILHGTSTVARVTIPSSQNRVPTALSQTARSTGERLTHPKSRNLLERATRPNERVRQAPKMNPAAKSASKPVLSLDTPHPRWRARNQVGQSSAWTETHRGVQTPRQTRRSQIVQVRRATLLTRGARNPAGRATMLRGQCPAQQARRPSARLPAATTSCPSA